ncbi:hypothetical protein PR048_006202 [Dryococelus australis]|uniref:Uncharacterized protein n=1 Tax=Dryococelus australis TaxID=614101 RepID=A0ABQ9IAW3_9NEOP|nr:hypothetical protein PR048_006202 [Dryococelus australis]
MRFDVVTLLVIQEIETKEYLSMFFWTVLNSLKSFPSGLSFVKEKISCLHLEHVYVPSIFLKLMKLKFMHGKKLKGQTLNPSATPFVRKYNLPSSDRVDAKSPDTVTSNPCAVWYEAKQRKALWRKYCQEMRSRLYAKLRLPQEQTYLTILMTIQCELGSECYRKYCNGINEDTEREVTEMDKDTLNESFYEPDELAVDSCNESDELGGREVDLSSYSQPGKKPEKYFIVAWSCLLDLLKICNDCKNEISNMSYYCKGAMMCIKNACACRNVFSWYSHPVFCKRQEGNVEIASSLSLDIAMFSNTPYDKIINSIISQVIKSLAGDGQYDSPGFCAKYVVYSLMDLHRGIIVDFELWQKGMEKGDLEKNACEDLISKHDRIAGVCHYIRMQHPTIKHEFDVWHLSKMLTKKIKKVEHKYSEIHAWKASISNHLWWVAQLCGGNCELLTEKFVSILHHIKYEHEWYEGSKEKKL